MEKTSSLRIVYRLCHFVPDFKMKLTGQKKSSHTYENLLSCTPCCWACWSMNVYTLPWAQRHYQAPFGPQSSNHSPRHDSRLSKFVFMPRPRMYYFSKWSAYTCPMVWRRVSWREICHPWGLSRVILFFCIYFFFNIFIFNWRIIALPYCVSFCHTSTCISHRYTYVPSLLSLPPAPFLSTLK